MAFRGGVGPVFILECRLLARRWQLYAGRAAFVVVLLAALLLVREATVTGTNLPPDQLAARVAENFFYAVTGTQLALVLLAAPALTAGALSGDKTRGLLAHLFVTDLSAAEIVLGKLAAGLLSVAGLMAAGFPVLALALLLGGIEPPALVGATLIAFGTAVLGCALALTLSVWGRTPQEVLLATYTVWAVALLAGPAWPLLELVFPIGGVPVWWEAFNPFWLTFAPYHTPGWPASAPLLFLAVTLGLSAVLVVVAILRVRAVVTRQAGRPSRRQERARRRGWPGPSLDRNPVLWRECHRRRPSRWTRAVWAVYAVGAAGFSAVAIGQALWGDRSGFFGGLVIAITAGLTNGFQVAAGLLLLSIVAVTSLAEDRADGTLDVLLTSPLSTWSIVWGKWWGTFRLAFCLTVLPGLVAAALAWHDGAWPGVGLLLVLILAYAGVVTSLGLAVATWVRRPARAAAVTAGLYTLWTVSWPLVVLCLLGSNYDRSHLVASGSPLWGAGLLTAGLDALSREDGPEVLCWFAGWIGFHTLSAAGLLLATWATFGHRLGRAAQTRPWEKLPPRAHVSPASRSSS